MNWQHVSWTDKSLETHADSTMECLTNVITVQVFKWTYCPVLSYKYYQLLSGK